MGFYWCPVAGWNLTGRYDQVTGRHAGENSKSARPDLAEFNGDRVRLESQVDGSGLATDWVNSYATKPLAKDSLLQFGELVRHLPELVDDVLFVGWENAYVVHASIE